MSIINKMLQDLDRRHARSAPPGQAPLPEVRAVRAAQGGHEWFWRVTAALLLVAAAWTVWVVYQLQPRSVATELAYRAAENSRRRGATVAVALQAPSDAVAAAPVAEAVAPPRAEKPAPEKLAAPIETLRLALTIDTPLAPRPARVSRVATTETMSRTVAAPRAKRDGSVPPRIEKRERERTPADRAEHQFRLAAQALERGRVPDAEEALRAALREDGSHQAARQTLIALYIQQGRIEEARRQLQEGLAFNHSYAPFAVALARIHVDRQEYDEAMKVLEQAGESGRNNPDFQTLRGAILQRLGRDSEAADAYRLALGSMPQSGASWVGLGISLEAMGNMPEAAEAYRRGMASGTLTKEVQAYAEQRVRQLQ